VLVVARKGAAALAIIAASSVLLPVAARAAGWAQFHGRADRSGVSTTEKVLTVASAPRLHRLWGAATRESREGINSSPAVVRGRVFVGSDDGALWAFDAMTGRTLWRDRVGSPVRSAPAVAAGRVFFGSSEGKVFADDAATGERRWSYVLGGQITAAPLVVGRRLYIGSRGGTLVALKIGNGRRVWSATPWGMWGGPAYADGTIFIGSERSVVEAYDATTGDRRWSTKLGSRVRSTPSVVDATVFVGTDAGAVAALDATTGAVRWRTPIAPDDANALVRSSPAVADGMVFVSTAETAPMNGAAIALDAATGDIVWRYPLADYATSSPAIANGVLYVGSYDTRLYAIDELTGELLWAPTWGVDNLPRGINSSPAIARGHVYVGCRNGKLYAFGLD
jgi:outer membrane protein assembly factor BamB